MINKRKKPLKSTSLQAAYPEPLFYQQENRQTGTNGGLYRERMIAKFKVKFGPTGSRWLSVIGSLLGVSSVKIKNVKVLCDGDELQGYHSIGDLILHGHLADKGKKYNNYNPNLFYLSDITTAMPHSPFLFLEALDEDDETVARFIGYDISTNLPRSLRYYHAANLPLRPQTRKAHILWSINFAKLIKSPFNPIIYQKCSRNADDFLGMDRLMLLLNRIESTIVLTDEERMVQYPPLTTQHH